MTAGIILLLVIGGVLALLLSGNFIKSNVQSVSSLPDQDLEEVFVDLKKQILVTSAYDSELSYKRLYNRVDSVLGRVLERHRHFVLDLEARLGDRLNSMLFSGALQQEEHHTSEGLRYTTYAVPRNILDRRIQPDVLLYLCFFLYLGGNVKHIGQVNSDPHLMLKILDHLISVQDHMPARFFKGLVLKYGLKAYHKPRLDEARELLEIAAKNGVGGATLELERFYKLRELAAAPSVHTLS